MRIFANTKQRKNGTQFLIILRVGIKNKSQQRTAPLELYRRDISGRRGGVGKTAETIRTICYGNNLLNQQYQINYGYPMPGINFNFGFNVSL